MKRIRLFFLLVVAANISFIQSCKLEQINPQCPSIISLDTNGAHSGDIVTIKGKNFLTGLPNLYRVSIGDKLAEVIDVPDSNTLRFKVPPGIGNGLISVSLAGGANCNTTQTLNFTYYYKATMVSELGGGGRLYLPAGLDLDNAGNLVVADSGNNQIKVIEPTTDEIIKTYGDGTDRCDIISKSSEEASIRNPNDIEVDLTGNMYMIQPRSEIIRWISANTPSIVQIFAGYCERNGIDSFPVPRLEARLTDPMAVAKDESSATFYFTDTGNIRKIDNSGLVTLLTTKPPKGYFYGIEISRSRKDAGPIFVTDLGALPEVKPSIKSIDEEGNAKTININLSTKLVKPTALAVDSRGNIFVADAGANQIFVIYTNGVIESLVPPTMAKFAEPKGIALNEKDEAVVSVYVSDTDNNVVRTIKIE